MSYKGCPHCGSTNFRYNPLYGGPFKCYNCGGIFSESETYDDDDDDSCPTCGSSNTVYYRNSRKHHYCNDCGTRW